RRARQGHSGDFGMSPRPASPQRLGRRAFLGQSTLGLGSLALASLLDSTLLKAAPAGQAWRGVVRPLHLPAKAKRVIFLYMAGGRHSSRPSTTNPLWPG